MAPTFIPLKDGKQYLRGMPERLTLLSDAPMVIAVRCPKLANPSKEVINLTNPKKDYTFLKANKKKFQVHVDVQHFEPKQITVKMIGNCWVVEGCHEEKRDDHGFVSRSFSRRFVVPDEVDDRLVTSKLSTDGVLTVEAPFKTPKEERTLPVAYAGPMDRVKAQKQKG